MATRKAGKSGIVIPVEHITQAIVVMRGHKVMLDSDLAALYEVEIRALNQAVRRNIERFPDDFMFQLTVDEAQRLRSQFVTLKPGVGSIANTSHTPSPNRASPCFPVSCTAIEPSTST